MNKVAVLAGVSATLGILLIDVSIKNHRLAKYVDEIIESNNYNAALSDSWKARNKIRQQEVYLLWKDLDREAQEAFLQVVFENEEYLDVVAPFPRGSV